MPRKKSAPAATTAITLGSVAHISLIPIIGSEVALAKLPGTGGTAVREDDVTLVSGRNYSTRDRTIPAREIFYVDGSKAAADGPWRGEADKLAWIDECTGYECIMLRDPRRGHLSGYVGVPHDHPLWGWDHEAVPAEVGIEVHGGLSYSRACEDGPQPARRRIVREAHRICHVPRTPAEFEPLTNATDHRPDAHVWWFGFACNHLYDLVPVDGPRSKHFMGAETKAEYRDDAYVVREILNLARQLRAIGDGEAVPAREGPPLPPVGLDPSTGR